MFCNNCGYFLDEKATVCPKCGEPVKGAKAEKAKEKKPAKEKKEGKKKSKKPVLIAAVAAVLVVAIVAGIVLSSLPVTPIKIFDAAEETLYESEKFTVTIVDSDKGETICIAADIGEDTSDTFFEVKRGKSAEEATLVFKLENGTVTDPRKKKALPVKDYIDSYHEVLETVGLDLDIITMLDEVLNNKIDKGAVEKIYNKEGRMLLGINFSAKFNQNIELPEYYTTKQIAERFLKDGIGEDTLQIKKVKSEQKGKTYEIMGKTRALIDDFVAFAKQDKDLKPMLQAFVDNDPEKKYKNIDEVAEALIVEVLALKPDEDIRMEITMKSGKITHIKDSHREITIETE